MNAGDLLLGVVAPNGPSFESLVSQQLSYVVRWDLFRAVLNVSGHRIAAAFHRNLWQRLPRSPAVVRAQGCETFMDAKVVHDRASCWSEIVPTANSSSSCSMSPPALARGSRRNSAQALSAWSRSATYPTKLSTAEGSGSFERGELGLLWSLSSLALVLLLLPPGANIAILSYARTVTRQAGAFAARHALGGSRARIVGQLVHSRRLRR